MLLNNPLITEEIKNNLRQMKMETRGFKTYGMQQRQFQKGRLQQYKPTWGNKKMLNEQSNLTPKETRKRRTNKTWS